MLVIFVYRKRENGLGAFVQAIYPYLFLVFASTVFCREPGEIISIRLIPFRSYYEAIVKGRDAIWASCLYNILMLMPVGVCLPFLSDDKTVRPVLERNTVLIGILISLSIETAQLVLKRGTFEIDDLIHNTFGVWLAWFVMRKIEDLRKKHSNEIDNSIEQ